MDDQPLVSGRRSQAASVKNGLNFNSIVFNRRVFSGLSSRPIALGRDSQGRLIFNSLDGIETTAEGRELLHYVAQCALSADDVLLVEVNGTSYELPGLFAGAPEWEHRDIDAAEKELVSACLLAHVNAYGVSVSISVRSPGVITADPEEISSHPVYEGTFFGDLFGPTLTTYACTGGIREIAIEHAPDRRLRSCADPSSDCQLTVVGRCRDVCNEYSDKYGWQGCWADGRRYDSTVSVFLHDANDDGLNQSCPPGEACRFGAHAGDAVLDCSDARQCTTTCTDGSFCTIEANSAAHSMAVAVASTSEINCQMTGECSALCIGPSSCDIDCWNAESCTRTMCLAGAECLLDCTGADDCSFAYCAGGVTTCENDVFACNRPCP